MFEPWFMFAIGTALCWTVYSLLARVIAKESESPLALAVPYGIYASIFVLIPGVWEPWTFTDFTLAVVVATVIATVGFAFFDIFQFFGRKHLEASQSTVLFQLSPVVTLVVAVIVLGESVTLLKVLAVGFIVLGNVIALYKRWHVVSLRGVMYMLLAAAGLGVAYVADKYALPHYPIALYALIVYLVPALYALLVFVARGERLSALAAETRRAGWSLLMLAAISAAGYYFVLKAFLLAEVSTVVPVVYSSTILTALAGIIILREHGGLIQKLVGAVIVVAGVILLQTA